VRGLDVPMLAPHRVFVRLMELANVIPVFLVKIVLEIAVLSIVLVTVIATSEFVHVILVIREMVVKSRFARTCAR